MMVEVVMMKVIVEMMILVMVEVMYCLFLLYRLFLWQDQADQAVSQKDMGRFHRRVRLHRYLGIGGKECQSEFLLVWPA